MAEEIGSAYLDEMRRGFRGHKRLAEGALEQLRDEELFLQLDGEANSVGILIKHIGGNLRSRFTDFLTTDGEKPDRNRDQEFVLDPAAQREELMRGWEAGWSAVFKALDELRPEDVATKRVTIRQQPHTVMQALNRAFGHISYHVGQIVLLAKHIRGKDWKTLSVPRGKTEEFNAQMQARWQNQSPAAGEMNPVMSGHVGEKQRG